MAGEVPSRAAARLMLLTAAAKCLVIGYYPCEHPDGLSHKAVAPRVLQEAECRMRVMRMV
jgi:hypothetical protein